MSSKAYPPITTNCTGELSISDYKVSHPKAFSQSNTEKKISASGEKNASSLDASVTSVIGESLSSLIPLQQSPEAFNTEYLQRATAPRAKIGGALAVLKIHGQDAGKAEAEDLIFQITHPEAKSSIQVRI